LSFGPSFQDAYRQLEVYAGRILKSNKPSDVPVIQPATFTAVINLRTATALGIAIPVARLVRRRDNGIR
jgi:putative tryptophan/tyrosine transport system substrate-binding protein